MRKSTIASAVMSVASVFSFSANPNAEPFPNHRITIVVPFPLGGSAGMISRILADKLTESLHQTVVIESDATAYGTIATARVASEISPDGHVLEIGCGTQFSAIRLFKSVGYDPAKDFAPLSLLGTFRLLLATQEKLPIRSIEDFVTYAQNHPGELSIGWNTAIAHIAAESLKQLKNIDINIIPYRSGMTTDLVGGQISGAIVDYFEVRPYLSGDNPRLRALVTINPEPSPLLPKVPTFQEKGIPFANITPWCGLFVAARTPKEIVDYLNEILRPIIKGMGDENSPLAAAGFKAQESTPEELGLLVREQLVGWGHGIRERQLEPR
jgi:tripartite-type tricarboxylate transporter receptor subunit TctC